MRRKWTLGLAAVAATAVAATMATSVLGGGSPQRPGYATVEIEMQKASSSPVNARKAKKAKKPKMIYLTGAPSPVDVVPSPPGTGPYIDVRLGKCPGKSRVVEGGVFPEDVNVFQQGSYVEGNQFYHVLIGFPDPSLAADFNLSSHLTCIKGVK